MRRSADRQLWGARSTVLCWLLSGWVGCHHDTIKATVDAPPRERAAAPSSTPPSATSSARAVSAKPETLLSVVELASVVPPTGSNLFRMHPVGDDEAYASYGLNLVHITRESATFAPDLSRGLPVQTDPCLAPAVHEMRRERSGRLVLVLGDAGSPHFAAGCDYPESPGIAYAWTEGRWAPIDLPAWAASITRATYQETVWQRKSVRLMGPRVAPPGDGWSPPEESEHLSVCFGARRPTLEGWDPPAPLPSLPGDLCVEAIAFGASAADALFFGRSSNGTMWLERKTPTTAMRTRVEVPPGCRTRTSYYPTSLGGVDDGVLLLGVACRKSPTAGDVEEREFSFRYSWKEQRLTVAAEETKRPPPSTREVVDLGRHFTLDRAWPKPWLALEDEVKVKPPVLLCDGVAVLDPAEQAAVFGERAALVEQAGRLLLVSPWRVSASIPARFTEDSMPEGRVLTLPSREPACTKESFRVARVPANEDARGVLKKTRERLGTLVAQHPEISHRVDRFVESRIGDHVLLIGHWALPEDGIARFRHRVLWRNVEAWARTSGFEFARMCIYAYPPGEGRSYRFERSGQIVWIDPSHAETPWK